MRCVPIKLTSEIGNFIGTDTCSKMLTAEAATATMYIELIKERMHTKDLVYIQKTSNEIITAFDDAIEAEIRSKETHEGLTTFKYGKMCKDPNGIGKVQGYSPTSTAYKVLHRNICERIKSHYTNSCSGAWFDVGWELRSELGAPHVLFTILVDWSGQSPKHLQDLERDVFPEFAAHSE
jgi:hypothetical protein